MTRHTSFWDRRRAAVKAEEAAAQQAAAEQAEAQHQAALAEKSDAELLAEFDLPDPDTLKAGDDFSAFMARAIPEHLRRRALRKLWVSDPALACLDDLVDYADDYTQASAMTNFTTSYEVGKGLRRHIEDVARKAAAALDTATDAAETPAETEPASPIVPAEVDAPAVAVAQADTPAEPPVAETAMEEPAALPPRRMAFRFEEQSA
ncbi:MULTISPECIES: DUF3306 domain-containing protein [Sulfitobacter]|jgi:hypothetical protein|uniref:DUF3306 domain-containing protein n=1 Tax=Sulfitobacter TaxID=60136 RepID=UPI0004E37C9E|nr:MULTISPECIES: DUF3306 domain-containing protein [unclassified Sulfitobacter]PTB00362.1 DUF3306 domain-containing protein [Sulfitobacter sp. CB-A]ULO20714.1 DUF3306 domain-containing protein [Sulfitobacter sp. CB2047]|tara:strand:- start:258 stop:875 length:618 start_codon:yes stop_codon:yes gene_type:complete